MGYFCSPQAFDSQGTFRPLKKRLGIRVKENESGSGRTFANRTRKRVAKTTLYDTDVKTRLNMTTSKTRRPPSMCG